MRKLTVEEVKSVAGGVCYGGMMYLIYREICCTVDLAVEYTSCSQF